MKLVWDSCFNSIVDSIIGDLESRLVKNQWIFSKLYLLITKEKLTEEWAINIIKEYISIFKIENNANTVEQLLSEMCLLPDTLELETINLESFKHLQILNGLLGVLLDENGSNAAKWTNL